MSSTTLTIDDNDARITYTGGKWDTIKGSSQQYDSTVHSTWDFNAKASLSFTGTGVWVYGTVPAGKGTSAVDFSLNANTAVRVWTDSGSTPIYGKEFFYSGALPFGTHNITMSNKGEDNDMDFELDRIVVELASTSSATASSSSPQISTPSTVLSTRTSSSSLAGSTSRAAGTSNSTPSASRSAPGTSISSGTPASNNAFSSTTLTATAGSSLSSSTSSDSKLVSKIVGFVAGILILLLILLFLFLWRRRSKFKEGRETPTPFYLDRYIDPVVTPEQNRPLGHSETDSSTSPIGERDITLLPGRSPLSLQIPTGPLREKYSLQTSGQSTSNPPLQLPQLPFTLTTSLEDRPPSYRRDV